MNDKLQKSLMGLIDARSNRGIMARGKAVYGGVGNSPNPTGINSSTATKLLQERRKKYGINNQS